MRVEYINPFVEAAVSVMQSVVSSEVKRGAPRLSNTMSDIMGVASIVGLAGQVSGRVIIDMSQSTALNIASSMNGEKFEGFDELVSATLTELGNMITGNAITKLHQLGFKFDLTPPALFIGDNLKITDGKIEALVVPLELPEGKIEINVAIKENF